MSYAINVKNLHYRYHKNAPWMLQDISFTLAEGQTLALLGPNGAGKSTLLMLLNGLIEDVRPELFTGSIEILGKQLNKKNQSELQPLMGFCFQDPDDQLFSLTVKEDICFGPSQLDWPQARIDKKCKELSDLFKLEKILNSEVIKLSGGEKRRATLAGILSYEPQLIFLDEPTSHLDPRTRRELKNLLYEIPHAKIVATHDLEFALDVAHEGLLLDHGQIIKQGPLRELLNNESMMVQHGLERPYSLRNFSET